MSVAGAYLPDVARPTVRENKPRVEYSLFHQGQREAYWSEARITLILAGTQGGKTIVGPPWLLKQIKERGPGHYIVAAPTFALMEKKVLPEFLRLFRDTMHLGEYKTSPVRRFTFSADANLRFFGDAAVPPTEVFFGYGEDPESLESMTAKAAWLDEPGQKKFKRESYEAVNRRLSIEQGPILMTTTPYLLGWLSELVQHADELGVNIINFPSIDNPRFPRAEWNRAQRELPPWKFNMFYKGLFERPAGMIYDCWSDENLVKPFTIPEHWPRHLGLDFGGVNTAGIYLAEELNAAGGKTGRFIAYREYHKGGLTAAQHAAVLVSREPRQPKVTGGSKSEDQWRWEFARAGLPVGEPPIAEVEVGINRVYGLIASRNLLVFDTLRGLRDQILSYSRELDDAGEPTEKIEDKETFHFLDALRYGVAGVTSRKPSVGWV